ncbi:MAG TPA: thioredoxin domain-containing protein [Burkholderiales bacterium]|nr:thioredoxin domain-containing protein [Burkholderiales bacterium]
MPNRLARETSPYLQQHAGNPVDWHAWGEEALARAREEDKPILLSVGYSACHWCHVMAHESFEDPAVAEVMNRLFVNVKVDREERPDLDQIYQLAHQMLAQRPGGWPLTMFLTPDGAPFFGGTYFPKEPRYNLPGFPQLLERVAQIYREHRDEIGRQNETILAGFESMQPGAPAHHSELSAAPIAAALRTLKTSFDSRYGGFGGAPKFPHPADLEFCLRRSAAASDGAAERVATYTLERMALGGIYDQIGGGFSRYSVDAQWMIPHFEKMLYDNGPLLRLSSDAWTATRNPLFARVAEETAGWAMREMQSGEDEGGYYSSLDADSEHEEGKFYVWTPEEAKALLSADEYAVLAPYYGLDGPPNFENTHWHLRVTRTLAAVAEPLAKSEDECARLLDSGRKKLFAVRQKRVRPGRDEKVLVSWNALMIAGMARAAAVFDREDWLASAKRALGFIRGTMWKNGRLFATYKDGQAHLNAYLDDYAYLLAALIEVLQAEFDPGTLAFAEDLAEVLLEQFEDRENGGFFFTSHDHERLIHRPKPGHDNATPSGNGTAAFALQRLHFLTGESRYALAAERTLAQFHGAMSEQPGGHATLLMALEEHQRPTRTVILRGPSAELRRWRSALARRHLPHTMVIAAGTELRDLPPALAKPAGGQVNAWVCEGVTCLAPIDRLEDLVEQVSKPEKIQ